MNKTNLYKIAFFLGYISILVATFIPVIGNLNSMKIGPDAFKIRLDFLLHFLVYLVICLYYLLGIRLGYKLFYNHAFLKFIIMVVILAIFTELVQIWVPSRSFNIFDIISNLVGVILGVTFIRSAKQEQV